jgi:energy-coupling factor transporter ATP-binding protein EcfA2
MSGRNEPAWVFLSYSSKNRTIVERLEQDLNRRDIPTWRDKSYIQSGNDWEAEIREAIRRSCALLYLASPDARASKVVRGELQVAKMYGKPIYLAWIEGGEEWADVAPLEYIAGHYIDLRPEEGQYEQGLQRLEAELKQSPQPPATDQDQQQKGTSDIRRNSSMTLTSSKKARTREPWPGLQIMLHALQPLSRLFGKPPNKPTKPADKQATLPGDTLPPKASDRQPRNPYKGLQAFTTEERRDFFGRDVLIDTMIKEVRHILKIEQQPDHRQEPRFLTVVGPSGSGKSSVVMAGLLPHLQDGKDIPGSENWVFLSPMRPGKEPLEALAQALLPQLPSRVRMHDVLDDLWDNSTRALHRYASELARQPGERVVLVVDQFEELFTETVDEVQRQQFVDLLAIAATEPRNKVFIIATLRADFSDYPMKYPILYRCIEEHRIPIPPMTIEDLRQVIECPAKLPDVQVSFEENLIGDLLLDIRGQEENLPLLQFTLDKLFKERNRDNCLTYQAYRNMGGVRGALSNHAEETYKQLPSEEHRRLAETLFTRLVNPGGLDQDATRRRVPRSEFIYSNATQQAQMQEVIDHFIAARLITTDEVETTNATTRATGRLPIIEISHEALISAWSRLSDWIKVARDDMFAQQVLDRDIEQWEAQNKPKNQLYSGHRLARIEALAERTPLNTTEEAFLRACKQQRRLRRAMNIGSVVIALLLLASGVAAGLVYAATRPSSTTVTTLQDSGPGSLSQVIQSTAPGSVITFDPSLQGTIYLNNKDLDIDNDLTIIGPQNQQITISNHNSKNGYKVHIHANATVTFENLRFSNSTVQQSTFIDNEGNLTLNNCIVDHNASYYNGGGIISYSGSLTLINSTVNNNRSYGGNGGGIYAWQGTTLKLINSRVYANTAGDNGGGIYAVGAGLTLSNSQVVSNRTTSNNVTSNGGGISILNGILQLDDGTTVSGNKTSGFGGGVALLGSTSLINEAVISNNSADQKGGGLAVEENFENKAPSLAVITNVEITDAPQGSYWIGDNNAPTSPNILGPIPASLSSGPIVINDDASEINGSPAPQHPPEETAEYLGTVNLDDYCHALHPNRAVSLVVTTSENIYCDLLSGEQVVQHTRVNTQQACQWRYKQSDVIDRLADYYDPSSWQCYAHEKKLGPITNYLNAFCQSKGYKGSNFPRDNAYEWDCLDRNNAPVSIAVADACQWYYQRNDAIDRLVNFNDPNGWECWAPE